MTDDIYELMAKKKPGTVHGKARKGHYFGWQWRKKRDGGPWNMTMELAIRKFFTDCILCNSKKSLEIDHVIPKSQGGILKPGNAIMLCKYCNIAKSDKSLDELSKKDQDKITKAAKDFLDYWDKNFGIK